MPGVLRRRSTRTGGMLVVSVLVLAACAGRLDMSYGDGGTVLLGHPADGHDRFSWAPSADGGLVVTGFGEGRVARLTRAGVLDPTWADLEPDTYLGVSRVHADGTGFVVFGSSPASGTRIVRLLASGARDPAFGGGDGMVDVATSTSVATAVLPDGGYLLVETGDGGPTDAVAPLVTHRLAADGTVLDRTEVPVFIDPASLAHTPPGFLDQWLTTVGLTTTSDGVVASVHLDAVGREGGGIFYGTTALVEFDAGGHLEAPWSTEGITPPALRSAEGIFQEWIAVTALPGGDRLVSTTRSGPAGETVSISLPGAWTITPTSPFDTSALRRTVLLPCSDSGRLLVAGEAVNPDGGNQPMVAAYRLSTGALDTSFGTDGYSDVPRTRELTDPYQYLNGLAPGGAGCRRFYAITTRFEGDGIAGGLVVSRHWGPRGVAAVGAELEPPTSAL
jgi:hypothetical protein